MGSRVPVALLACGSFNPPTNMHLRMFERGRDYIQKNLGLKVTEGLISPASDGYGKPGLAPAKHRMRMVELATETSDWLRLEPWECSQPNWSRTLLVLRQARESLEKKYGQPTPCPPKTPPIPASPAVLPGWSKATANSTMNHPDDIGPSPAKRPTRKRKDPSGDVSAADNGGECDSKSLRSSQESLSISDSGSSVTGGVCPHLMLICGADLLESFAVPNLWAKEDMESIVRDFGLIVITREGSDPRKFVHQSDMLTKYEKNIHIVTEWIPNEISATSIRRAIRRGESVRYLTPDSVIDNIHQHKLYREISAGEESKEPQSAKWVARNGEGAKKTEHPAYFLQYGEQYSFDPALPDLIDRYEPLIDIPVTVPDYSYVGLPLVDRAKSPLVDVLREKSRQDKEIQCLTYQSEELFSQIVEPESPELTSSPRYRSNLSSISSITRPPVPSAFKEISPKRNDVDQKEMYKTDFNDNEPLGALEIGSGGASPGSLHSGQFFESVETTPKVANVTRIPQPPPVRSASEALHLTSPPGRTMTSPPGHLTSPPGSSRVLSPSTPTYTLDKSRFLCPRHKILKDQTVTISDTEELMVRKKSPETWRFDPERTKSLPILPPKGARVGKATSADSGGAAKTVNNLIKKVKDFKISPTPETTV